MKLEAKNRLTMSRGAIAARRAASRLDCYSWVWVLPLRSGQFRVAAFEVPKRLIENDISFFDEDMQNVYVKIVDSVDEVDAAVWEAGVEPDELDAPWRSEFPL